MIAWFFSELFSEPIALFSVVATVVFSVADLFLQTWEWGGLLGKESLKEAGFVRM